MKRGEELAKNTIIIFIGTICTKLMTFLLLPLYTSILSTEEYGLVDLLTTLVSLCIPLITFQTEQAVFRELLEVRNKENEKSTIISSGVISVLFQCIITAIIFMLFSPFIKNEYKFLLVFNVYVNIFSSLFLQISRGLGDNKKYSIGSIISVFFTIVFNLLFLLIFNMGVIGMLLGTLLGQLVSIIYLFISLKLYNYIFIKKFKKNVVRKLWKYSLPLVPNSMSWWVFGYSDRVIVSFFLGLSMNGILSVASKFSGAYTILYNIFDRSWIESISLHIDDNDIENYFNNMFNKILKIFSGIMLVLISFMPIAFKIMVNKNFIYGYKMVPPLLIGALFNVIQGLVVVIYAAKKDTKSIAKTSIAAAVLNIVIHLALIKFIGLYAAVISTMASYILLALYRYFDVRKKYLKIKIETKLFFIIGTVLSIEIVLYYINCFYLNIINVVSSIFVAILLNKDILKIGIVKLKNRS